MGFDFLFFRFFVFVFDAGVVAIWLAGLSSSMVWIFQDPCLAEPLSRGWTTFGWAARIEDRSTRHNTMPGTWQRLTNQPAEPVEPFEGHLILLTDGSVLWYRGAARWERLTPDRHGQYHDGTWSPVDPMHFSRTGFGATVLADGRVLVLGDTNPRNGTIELLDPQAAPTRQWRSVRPGWGADIFTSTVLCPLADARRVLISRNLWYSYSPGSATQLSLFDVSTERWRTIDTPSCIRDATVRSLTLLPDGSVFVTGCRGAPLRYLPDSGAGTWVEVDAESQGEHLSYSLLLPDGRVWAAGWVGESRSVMYTPPGRRDEPGRWAPGPEFPGPSNTLSSFSACLLPSGTVLCFGTWGFEKHVIATEASTGDFFELDPFAPGGGAITRLIPRPPVRAVGRYALGGMLPLPTGEALVALDSEMLIYRPSADDPAPRADWRPRLARPRGGRLTQGQEVVASGMRINGNSQAVSCAYWRLGGAATNYPIIRLRHSESGRVWYCQTHDHSSMGVATGEALKSTRFMIPRGVPDGEAELCIIANGIVGDCVPVTIGPPLYDPILFREAFKLIGNLADGPLIVFGPNGPMPLPPFGPEIDEVLFRKAALQAYESIFFGLCTLNTVARRREDQQTLATESFSDPILSIEHGLGLLRKLGDQLEESLKRKPSGQ